jgi:hypothetical protein
MRISWFLHNVTLNEWFGIDCECICDLGTNMKRAIFIYKWSLDDTIELVTEKDIPSDAMILY